MRFMMTIKANKNSEAGMTADEKLLTGRYNADLTKTSVLLSIVQALLAAISLFAGGMKRVLPLDALTKQTPLPGAFLRFIGVKVLGAIGLILPGRPRIRPSLIPLAAARLVIIMIAAPTLAFAQPIPARWAKLRKDSKCRTLPPRPDTPP